MDERADVRANVHDIGRSRRVAAAVRVGWIAGESVAGFGRGRPANLRERFAKASERRREVGPALEGGREAEHGVGSAVLRHSHLSQVEMAIDEIGVESTHGLKAFGGEGQVSVGLFDEPQFVPCQRELRLNAGRLFQTQFGAEQVSLPAEDDSEPIVQIGIVRVEMDSVLQVFGGVFESPEVEGNGADIAKIIRARAIKRDRSRQALYRLCVAVGVTFDESQLMPRFGMMRIDPHDATEKFLGLGQFTRLVKGDGLVKCSAVVAGGDAAF